MADFKAAEAITGRNEGGYANNKADKGGETFAGIARNFWAQWLGWKYIDRYKDDYYKAKATNKTKLNLAQWVNASAKVVTEPVLGLISEFYRVNFWHLNRLEDIKDQQVANSVYDFGVNSGKGRAAKFLQEAVGTDQDGKVGQKTIDAVNAMNPKQLLTIYNKLREEFYREIAVGDQKQFLTSWLSRLRPYK